MDTRGLNQNKITYIDSLVELITSGQLAPCNLPSYFFSLEPIYREYFVKQFGDKLKLSSRQQLLLAKAIVTQESVVKDSEEFDAVLWILMQDNIDFYYSKLDRLFVFEKKLAKSLLKRIIELKNVLNRDNNIDEVTQDKFKQDLSCIQSNEDLERCVEEIQLIIRKAAEQAALIPIDTNVDERTLVTDSHNSDVDSPMERLLLQNDTPRAPKKDSSLKSWFIYGACAGLFTAAFVLSCVFSFGAVPAALGIGVLIGAAVSIMVGSTVLGGLAAVVIKKIKDIFKYNPVKISLRSKKVYKPVQQFKYDNHAVNNDDEQEIMQKFFDRITEESSETKTKIEKLERARLQRQKNDENPNHNNHAVNPPHVVIANPDKDKEELSPQAKVVKAEDEIPVNIHAKKQGAAASVEIINPLQILIDEVNHAIMIAPKNKRGMFQGQAPAPLRKIQSVLKAMQDNTYNQKTGLLKIAALAEGFGGKHHKITLAAKTCLRQASNDHAAQLTTINRRNNY